MSQEKPPLPDFWDLTDIAEKLGVGINYMYAEIKRGHLIAYKFGKSYKVKPQDFDAYLEIKKSKPDASVQPIDEE